MPIIRVYNSITRDLITLKDKQPAAKDFLQDENKFDDFSSFAVFDGHGGVTISFISHLYDTLTS